MRLTVVLCFAQTYCLWYVFPVTAMLLRFGIDRSIWITREDVLNCSCHRAHCLRISPCPIIADDFSLRYSEQCHSILFVDLRHWRTDRTTERRTIHGVGFVQMTGLIGERETKVTQALTTIGMMRSSYWLSWMVWEVLLAFFVTLISMAFGAICQIDFFLKNSFGNVFFTLFFFQLAMVGFAFFLASFIRKSSMAISLGFVLFLIGFAFSVCIPHYSKHKLGPHEHHGLVPKFAILRC